MRKCISITNESVIDKLNKESNQSAYIQHLSLKDISTVENGSNELVTLLRNLLIKERPIEDLDEQVILDILQLEDEV